MKKILIIFAVFLLLAVMVNAEQLNVKTIDYVKLKITQSGSLNINGIVEKANLSYYVPQNGIQNIDVIGDGGMIWRYIFDSFNNKMVLLEWKKPTGMLNYRIEITVENRAKHMPVSTAIGTDDFYLKQTDSIRINDDIRQFAFPFEKSMKRAAELTAMVNDYLTYDLSYVSRDLPSDQILKEKRGVCVQYANLLAALLKASDIPTRYVVGYAYSSVQEKFIGHTWVEILTDNGWVALDPTWLEAGYLDATHVENAYLMDNGQTDTLTYLGGDIDWTRTNDQIEMLEYTQNSITTIKVSGSGGIAPTDYGYVKAAVSSDECTLLDITANSCVDSNGVRQLDIQVPNRTLWLCEPQDVYWFFKPTGNNYICPVSVYDQMGGRSEYRVTVGGKSQQSPIFITGPETVLVNELFTLTASTDGIFYSTDFGLHAGTGWRLSIKKSGVYKFYLYAKNNLYEKTINVVQTKEFGLSAEAANTVNFNAPFYVNVTVKSLLGDATPLLTVKYTNQTVKQVVSLKSGEEKIFVFRLIANKEGPNDISISVTGNSLASQTLIVNTLQERKSGGVFGAIADFFSGIISAIMGLFGGKS